MMEGPGSTSVLLGLSCTLESSGKFKNINQVNQNVQLQGQASAFPSSFLSKFQHMVGLGTSLIHKGKLGTGSPRFIVYWKKRVGLCRLGDGDRQGGLACCYSWGHKESDTTERLN